MNEDLRGWYVEHICRARNHTHPLATRALLECALQFIADRGSIRIGKAVN